MTYFYKKAVNAKTDRLILVDDRPLRDGVHCWLPAVIDDKHTIVNSVDICILPESKAVDKDKLERVWYTHPETRVIRPALIVERVGDLVELHIEDAGGNKETIAEYISPRI